MLPDNVASSLPLHLGGIYLSPDEQVVKPYIDFERGGVALLDTSQGLMVKNWSIWLENQRKVMLKADGAPAVMLFEDSGLTEVSLAFDQNMRWSAAYLRFGVLTLRWYDTVVSDHVVSSFGPGRCPRLALDDKRSENIGNSDIIFAYIKGDDLCYRQQRDRYLIERTLKANLYPGTRLRGIGMNKNLRMQFELVE